MERSDEKNVRTETRISIDSYIRGEHWIPSGTMATVREVNEDGSVSCVLDSGCCITLLNGRDQFHIIAPEQDHKTQLAQKLEQNYEQFLTEWKQQPSDTLISDAQSIGTVQLMMELLFRTATNEQAEHLLKFKNPLEVMSDAWYERYLDDLSILTEKLKWLLIYVQNDTTVEEEYDLEDGGQAEVITQ